MRGGGARTEAIFRVFATAICTQQTPPFSAAAALVSVAYNISVRRYVRARASPEHDVGGGQARGVRARAQGGGGYDARV